MAKDSHTQIKRSMCELNDAKSKHEQGSNLSSEEIKLIKDYYSRKQKMDNLRGNQWKRESIKLSNFRREIKGFDRIDGTWRNYLQLGEKVLKLEENIKAEQSCITRDIDRMLNYLYDNHYISLKSPFNELSKEQCKIQLQEKSGSASNSLTSDKIILDLKGIIASQISECNEIMLTEIITNKFFESLEPAEVVAILAAFIEEKANDVTTLDKLDVPDSVKEILGSISYIADDFGSYEYNSGIEIESDWKLYLSFIGPAYEWAKGCTIFEIYQKYPEVYEGTFIRNILRLYNMVENIRGIATMCDQPQILKCLENIDSLLVRDQVTTESLYITK